MHPSAMNRGTASARSVPCAPLVFFPMPSGISPQRIPHPTHRTVRRPHDGCRSTHCVSSTFPHHSLSSCPRHNPCSSPQPMPTHSSILLIDDSPGECELFRLALRQSGLDVAIFSELTGPAALHFLTHHPALPSVILLDWHLGNQRGDGWLRQLRETPRLAGIPVVVFTTSDDAADLLSAYAGGANGYVVKPGTFAELVQCTGDICRYWIARNRTLATVTTSC